VLKVTRTKPARLCMSAPRAAVSAADLHTVRGLSIAGVPASRRSRGVPKRREPPGALRPAASAIMAARKRNRPSMDRRARYSATAWIAGLAAAAMLAFASPAGAQDVEELLRMRVERLRETGALTIDGSEIAARRLVPE